MAVGLAAGTAAAILDGIGNAAAFSLANNYVKLHVGDPGAAGTANAATETTRKLVSFGAASAGTMQNDVAILWSTVAGSEDYTHYSSWSASSGGTFQFSGTVTANAVTAGDDFNVAIGGLVFTLTGIAA
jgi:hypothetical protein